MIVLTSKNPWVKRLMWWYSLSIAVYYQDLNCEILCRKKDYLKPMIKIYSFILWVSFIFIEKLQKLLFFISQSSENMKLKKLLILFCSIEANSRIMDLDPSDGSLKVHYSDRLVILLREVRQLSALGFVIPAKIQQVANIAQKFCKQAIILKQVWHHIFEYMTVLSSLC